MKYIAQRESKDCGVACVAMIANISYNKAKKVFTNGRPNKKEGTKTIDLHQALNSLKIKTKKRLTPFRNKKITDLNNPAILKVLFINKKNWHWVVYNPKNKSILDPDCGMFYIDDYKKKITSYLK